MSHSLWREDITGDGPVMLLAASSRGLVESRVNCVKVLYFQCFYSICFVD